MQPGLPQRRVVSDSPPWTMTWAARSSWRRSLCLLMKYVRQSLRQNQVESDVPASRIGANLRQSGLPLFIFAPQSSYGAAKGYAENGQAVPYETNMGGAYLHAAEHNNQPPYNLPESWLKAKLSLDLKTPLNFVSTADIIGGNSGS